MVTFLIHFALGLSGALGIFLLFFWLSLARSTSAPFGLIFLGITCGVAAHTFSPWATPVILLVYAGGCWREPIQDQRTRYNPGQ